MIGWMSYTEHEEYSVEWVSKVNGNIQPYFKKEIGSKKKKSVSLFVKIMYPFLSFLLLHKRKGPELKGFCLEVEEREIVYR